jgi:hypothetical protein
MAALVLGAVACWPQASSTGHLEVVNLTTVEISIATMDGSQHRFTVPPCARLGLDDFPLNRFRIESATSPNGYVWGASVASPVLIVTATGPEIAARVPDPLPACVGSLP